MGKKNLTENIIVKIITYLANLIILNVLFLICSLPVFTYGAAASALYYMTCELKAGETVVVRGFFRAFKEQFKQATKSWILLMIPGIFLFIEANLLLQVEIEVPPVVHAGVIVPAIAYFCYLPWVLIQPVYFYCTQRQQLKNAVLLVLQRLPQSFVMAMLQLFPVWVFLMKTVTFMRVWPLWLFLYGAIAWSAFAMLADSSMRALRENIKNQLTSGKYNANIL